MPPITRCGTAQRNPRLAFNGEPDLLGSAVGAVYGLKKQAQSLLSLPAGDGRTAGPTFEYVPPAQR
ncbi:hypothetical protein [Cryptosporangium sp. NPDC051539]|uniref:hypothetical protein n=1 Tax=Cryptosporangium sp. NPDC051539 TaxID=3363962 RepID=UPI00378D4FCF